MRSLKKLTEVELEYARACEKHYNERDFPSAFQLYMNIIATHPDDKEAEYSRMQIDNIVNATIPKQELLNAHTQMLLAHFEHDELLEIGQVSVEPLET